MGDGDGREAAGTGLDGRAGHGSWRVRLRRWAASGSGDVLGAGVLFGSDRVLTCAHVVRDPATGQRPDRVQVEFPHLQGLTRTPCRTATVEAGHWVPPFGKAQGDLAVLVLDEPAPVPSPVTLHRTLDYRGAAVLIDGFPEYRSGGQWLTGACMGPGGEGDERVQIDVTGAGGLRGGFSGSGVREEGGDRLLGIVAQADASGEHGYMIPAATVAKYFRRFAERYVTGPHAVPGHRVVSAEAARKARPHGLQRTVTRWLNGDPGAWDTEVVFIAQDDERARQALYVVLNMADREQAPQLAVSPLDPADGAGPQGPEATGAPLLSRAGITPRVGSIGLVLDLEGVAFDDPAQPELREALAVLRHELRHAGHHPAARRRPAVAVLHADRSATEPAAAARVLAELGEAGARLLLVVRDSAHGFPYAMAERLLPAGRAAQWLQRIGARVDELADAERRARRLFHRVEPHVVDPPVATGYAARAALWTVQLSDELRPLTGRGGPRLLEKLSYAEQAVETHLLRAEAAESELRAVLDAHLRLRALLRDHLALLAGRGLAEHPDAVGPYREAQRLLMAGPCPLADAERAVEAFARVARRLVAAGGAA
ncbi:trypsin-like serine peptidase [Streptomyces alfalfae]|uniref:Trypsin-like peptidase domain-containing protein n=1 Tax=Streptomyces alfalfae TaxID=1642299 RepID=A0A7T4TYY4_9ACTN|nr:serine protease [Streptomyces alfalfae]QQC89882.1 trypsin-like peptidase domain-containing protein [Streptomyces alfalfae]QUI32259.1 trypsin-like peptidase domain-containing protein [Streptomyces alfalfae]